MSLAGNYNFRVQRGADFSRVFVKNTSDDGGTTLTPVDLTGLKVRAQFRDPDGATGTTTDTTLLLELEDSDGIEITDAAAGEITLTITNAQTETLCPDNIKTVVAYGIELYNDGGSPEVVTAFLQGKVTVLPETVR